MNKKVCSFCGEAESPHNPIVEGNNGRICRDCVYMIYNVLEENLSFLQDNDLDEEFAPRKKELKELIMILKSFNQKLLKNFLMIMLLDKSELKKFLQLQFTTIIKDYLFRIKRKMM